MTPAEIIAARKELGLTQAGLARMLGYSSRTGAYKIETGLVKPSAAVVRLLRAYLDGYRPEDWPLQAKVDAADVSGLADADGLVVTVVGGGPGGTGTHYVGGSGGPRVDPDQTTS